MYEYMERVFLGTAGQPNIGTHSPCNNTHEAYATSSQTRSQNGEGIWEEGAKSLCDHTPVEDHKPKIYGQHNLNFMWKI